MKRNKCPVEDVGTKVILLEKILSHRVASEPVSADAKNKILLNVTKLI